MTMRHKFVILALFFSLVLGAAPNAMCQWVKTGSYNNIFCLTASGTDLFAGTSDSGVYRSSDNGTTWTPPNKSDLSYDAAKSLGMIGTNLVAGSNGYGIFFSTDNGINWTLASSDLESKNVDIYAL